MQTIKRLFQSFVLVTLVLSPSASQAEGTKIIESRPIVIRYDGASINLPTDLVHSLLNRESIRKKIHEDLVGVAILSDRVAIQPAGVLAGTLHLEVKEETEVEPDALFKSARTVIGSELADRLWEPQMIRLDEQRGETRERLQELEEEVAVTRTMMEEELADGQLESMQLRLNSMQEQKLQVQMESKVEKMRTKLLQEALRELAKQKEALEQQKSTIEKHVDEQSQMNVEFASKLFALKTKKVALQQSLGQGHPKLKQIAEEMKTISEAMGSADTKMLGRKQAELARTRRLADAVVEELNRLNQQTAALVKEQQDRGMAATLAEFKLGILATETEPVREQVGKLRRDTPRFQSRLEGLQNSMKAVRTEQEHIETKLRNLQRVTVEIW